MTEYSRLPEPIIPCHYNVHLEPNFSSFSVHGKVEISVEVTKQTETIVLNARNISVSKLKLMKSYSRSTMNQERILETSIGFNFNRKFSRLQAEPKRT